jgi:hypothetical protein
MFPNMFNKFPVQFLIYLPWCAFPVGCTESPYTYDILIQNYTTFSLHESNKGF